MPTSRGELAPLVEELLADAVDSFEKLEIVLHLRRSQSAVTASEIARTIGIPGDISSDAFDKLARCDVVTKDGPGWRLARRGRWNDHLEGLFRAAEADRTELYKFLTARAMDRVRAEAARVFADAFVLRPKKNRRSED